ncbi:aryl-hydrocarbon receptor repressor a [Chanos chanos]|uniref:Aryl hydrocarbon receptor repressor n=1 Tax=Chanos chanos TaxID=29144 RepID=A0A6J2UZM6_CHACN|nr:uncharacterized protein LOC115808261 [Chanos chanos]
MIPPGDCMYAGRKRRKPIQKQKPAPVTEKSNPSKRHRDRLNAELDRLASLLPFSPDIISKLDKLSVLRLSVSYLRVKSFFQANQEKPSRKHVSPSSINEVRKESLPSEPSVTESELLLESLTGFALVVSSDGMVFYASSTIVDYLGFHQTDVMHQNVFDYIHVDDRQEFRRQLHWAMNPTQQVASSDHHSVSGTGEDFVVSSLFHSQEAGGIPPEYTSFLNRCFISRVRCLLDSTSGFLTMQFQGRLKFLHGQKKKTGSGATMPPQLALFCVAVPLLLPSITEMKMKGAIPRAKYKNGGSGFISASELSDREDHGRRNSMMGDRGDSLLLNCSIPTGPLRQHAPWTPLSKDNVKYKSEAFYGQDEPLNFCKSSAGGQRITNLDNSWIVRDNSGAIRTNLFANSRLGKVGHYGKPYRMSPSFHGNRAEVFMPKLYGSLQQAGQADGYCVDGIKSENGYEEHPECYGGRLMAEVPIKVEQDSDSENGCDVYGRPWGCRERYNSGGGSYDGLQVKAEDGFYEQYSPCQRAKANSGPAFNGQYQTTCGSMNRPLKCVLNKESMQLSPHRLAHPDQLCSTQSTNCMDSYGSSLEHKGYMQPDYKQGYEFKGQGLLHTIKREPMDSPPWHDSGRDMCPSGIQRNIMPNCVMSTEQHKANPYIYMQ